MLDDCGLLAEARPGWLIQYFRLRSYVALQPGEWPAITTEYPTGNRLGAWCAAQRRAHRKGVLSAEHLQLLDALEFPWERVQAKPENEITSSREQSREEVTVSV